MKILQLCNKVPYPPHDGGAIAVLNISRSLVSAGHEVVVLAMNTEKHYTDISEIPSDLSSKIRFIYIPVDTRIRPWTLLMNFLFSDLPYHAVRFNSPVFRETLINILKKESFDIIQLEGLYLKPYMDTIRQYHNGKVVFRAHNIESMIWSRLASQSKNPLRRFYLKNLAGRIFDYEKDFMNQYDLLAPIAKTDLDTFQHMGNIKPANVIVTGIADDDFREEAVEKDPYLLFFIGALDWTPNQDGLIWFIDKIWPKLKTHQPEYKFHVAGRNAPDRIEKLCRKNGIVFHGEVKNAHQFMDEFGIMIVPLFAGSGLRIKIIEAMARSKVVFTTTIGAQGFNIETGIHGMIIDDPEEFYNSLIHLSSDAEHIGSIKKNSYLFIRENFSNSGIIKNLLSLYQEA